MVLQLSSLICLGAIASTAVCAPPRPFGFGPRPGGPPAPPARECSRQGPFVQTQVLQTEQPTDGLPPNTNATLQFVGLGVGIQNYSCSSTTAVPTSIGAIATLFDATNYLSICEDPASSTLAANYLDAYTQIPCQASPDLSDSCQEQVNDLFFPLLGHHFFISVNGAGVPFFEIYSGDSLSAQKTGDVKAPAGSPDADEGFGAVDWLFLPSDGSSRTNGLSEVYRVNTAGGNPDPNGCASGESVISYKYAAEYWFYK